MGKSLLLVIINVGLFRLTQKLKKSGLIKSQRGPFGGYMLAKPRGKITVGDIVRVLEGIVVITECSGEENKLCGVCNRAGDCLSKWVWIKASRAMFECLDQITLEFLINSKKNILEETAKLVK
jgi:Rrf2 family transcriptional regulator, iron-sulfur cluster assembly transcription factor